MWNSFKSQIKSAVATLNSQHPVGRIMVTGHSLGGAIATLAGLDLRSQYGAKVQMIHFGSPRVGNEAFYNKVKATFGASAFRVTHANDIVPHWPKALSHAGYHHIEKEVWYTSNSAYKECNDSGEDPSCSDSVTGDSIADHLNYLGHSTACNNADSAHLELLELTISPDSLEFYNYFEDIVLACDSTGFVKSVAMKYGQEFLRRESEF